MEQELEIAKRIAKGDKAAFRLIFDKYKESVLRLCYAMTRDDFEAEDLTQDVFVEVFCSIGSFKGKSQLSTWIYRIAINKSINYIRKKKVRRLFLSKEITSRQEAYSPSADTDLRDSEYKKYFDKAIAALPNKQRTAFVLFMYEQMPYKEIAELMKSTPNAAEVLVHRARKSIEHYIESLDKELLR